jgi:CubicO group peptidase (beta-lactamase class C family)
MERVLSILQDGIDSRDHLGAQVCILRSGEVLLDAAVGENRPAAPLTSNHLLLWMSAVKPVASVAMGLLRDRGRLEFSDPVARHVPEFAANGKERVTIEHLLTHTAGFRMVANTWNGPWEEVIQRICDARLEPGWVPGEKAGYHTYTSWLVLAEIIRRLDGRMYSRFAREEIFEPLGMPDSWVGMPESAHRAYGDRIGASWDTSRQEIRPSVYGDDARACAMERPAGNGRGPLRELARFYECLRTGGAPLLARHTTSELVTRRRIGMLDHTFHHIVDFSLGFIVNSSKYGPDTVPYGYGPYASESTFGHSGNQCSCAFCDPEHELVVAWACNGMPGENRHQKRQRAINRAIYVELGLAGA